MPLELSIPFQHAISAAQKEFPAVDPNNWRGINVKELPQEMKILPERFSGALEQVEKGVRELALKNEKRSRPVKTRNGRHPMEEQHIRNAHVEYDPRNEYNELHRHLLDLFKPVFSAANQLGYYIAEANGRESAVQVSGSTMLAEQITRKLLHSCMEGMGVPIPKGISL